MIIYTIRYFQFIIVFLLLNALLIAPCQLAMAGENELPKLSNIQADQLLHQQLMQDYDLSRVQIPFTVNEGQIKNDSIIYFAKTFGGTVFVTKDGEIVYSLPKIDDQPNDKAEDKQFEHIIKEKSLPKITKGWSLKEQLVGALSISPQGIDASQAKVNYFIGNDKSNWHSNIATYNMVALGEIYPGIDLDLRATGKNVEKVFTLNPGAEVNLIKIKLEGSDYLNVNDKGELEVGTGLGVVYFTSPVAYQEKEGKREYIQVSYQTEKNTYGFTLGNYDQTRPLIIDPLLASTFLGGGSYDSIDTLTIDDGGNIYVAGYTDSANYPATTGAYDTSYYQVVDGFVSKIDADLDTLLASTFIGGNNSDVVASLAIDPAGDVYLAGYIVYDDSPYDWPVNYPTTDGAYDASYNGGFTDNFISKLDASLGTLLASTFIGGNSEDRISSLAIDGEGNVCVAGSTDSANYPITAGAYDMSKGRSMDSFVTKLDAGLSTVLTSTFIGGSSGAQINAIAIDDAGNVYTVGSTGSTDYPTTAGAYDKSYNLRGDCFVSKLDAGLHNLLASTYIGGRDSERITSLAIDGTGTVYLAGNTNSADYPVTPGAYDTSYNGGFFGGGFVSMLDAGLGTLLASTFICGSEWDVPTSLAIDNAGNVYVAGYTWSADYPTTDGAFDASYNGREDGFISKLDANLRTVLASSFIGGSDNDILASLAIDNSGNVYVAGITGSIYYPTTTGAYDPTFYCAYPGMCYTGCISKISGDPSTNSDKSTLGIRPYCLYGKGSVNLSTGNFILTQPDLDVPSAGPSLEFTRFYNSQNDYIGTQGKGWNNNYNVHLTKNRDNSVSIAYDDGHVYTFAYNGTSYVRPAGCFEILTVGPYNGYTLTFKDQTRYIFNNTGQLNSIIDQNNNTLTLTYNGNQLTFASEPTGRTLSFNYNTDNRLTGVTDPAGRSVTYTYDNEGNLATVQDALGNITQYHYNTQGLTEIIAPDSNILLRNTYDSSRVTQQNDGNGNTTLFNYDPDNQQTTMTETLGNTIIVVYDEKYRSTSMTYPGNITETFTYDANNCSTIYIDALNHTTSYTYDDNGNILTVTDPAGNQTNMTYDGKNNLLSIENAAGKRITNHYDVLSNLTGITDPLGNSTTYTYDGSGRLLSKTTPEPDPGTTSYTYQEGLPLTITSPAGNLVTCEYDTCGRLSSLSDAVGTISTFAYDAVDNLTGIADALGNTTTFTYDWRHNKLTETDPKGNVTRYAYDGNGKLTSVVNALGYVTQLAYDSEGHLIKVTDARGNATNYSYDALGQLTKITDSLGHNSVMQYDTVGNLTEKIDTLGKQSLTVDYDELNRPTILTDALGQTVKHDYDNLSRITNVTDPEANVTQFTYDDLNRLTSSTDPLLGQGSQKFDKHGNRIEMVDPNNNMTSFSYDKADRLIGKTTTTGGSTYISNARDLLTQKINARGQTTNYVYDNAGRLVCLSELTGTVNYTYDQNGNLLTAVDSTGMTSREYDALNRMVKYTDTKGNIIQYSYDAVGNLVTLTYPGDRQVSYEYDAANQLTSVIDWAGRETNYEYDSNGRLLRTVCPNGGIMTRTYNDAGRVTQQKDTDPSGNLINQYDYTYEPVGNIANDNDSNERAETEPLPTDSAALTYAADNRLASFKGQDVLYDADGNMTNGPFNGNMANFTYDSRNRLTSAGDTNYTYDAGNNRISVVGSVYQKSFIVNPNASLSQVLIETDAQNGKTYYVYGLGLIGQETEGGDYRTYHFDYRGSTVSLTDNNCLVTDRFQYAPYGEMTLRSGDTPTPFLYNGRYGVMADASDLYYMRARYYNPVAQRFLSPDSLTGQVTNPQSQNLYAFCESNPVNNVDPTGKDWTRAQYFVPEFNNLNYEQLYDLNEELGWEIENLDPDDIEDLKLQRKMVNEFLIIKGADELPKDTAQQTLAEIMDEENKKAEMNINIALGAFAIREIASSLFVKSISETISSYSELKIMTRGYKGEISAHHIAEVRHLRNWGYTKQEIENAPAVILSRPVHQAVTNALRSELPYGKIYSREEVWKAYQRVYQNYPDYLNAIRGYF